MASLSSLIIMSILCSAWAAQDFQSVPACPRDDVNWKSESVKKNCQGDTPDYLCAAIENQPNKYGQICTKYGLTPANKCAVLNEQTFNLDSVDCKADSGCPTGPYIPSELWRYQICYGDFYGTTTMAKASTTQKTINETTDSASRSGDSGSGAGLKAGVVVAVVILSIILIIVVVIGILVAYRKNVCGFKDKVDKRITVPDDEKGKPSEQPLIPQDVEKGQPSEQAQPPIQQEPVYAKPNKDKTKKDSKPAKRKTTSDSKGEEHIHDEDDDTKQKIKKLNELQKYLVHILKQELDVNDLKEKAVIHSKSIHEHFTEQIINCLQSIKDRNDYSRLDMSLVFALLRNFCEGIKPPSRGWDYEPPDDETYAGADIERIRSMWNKYCDNDSQFKHLDDVYNRMKQKYGTVAVHGDDSSKNEDNTEDFEEVMEKIQSIRLNEDCTVKKGIVLTENITTALYYLKSRKIVILKGVIGCGKTHAFKAIQNHFQDMDWQTVFVESEDFQGKISHVKPTIILWDNLFGKFGCSVFSQDAVNKTEKVLKEFESSKQETKVVIGIHTHVYEEVKKYLKLNILSQKNITVEMDNLSEAETLLIFKEQLKNGHCKNDSNCWFKTVGFQSVLDKLSKNQGHIGGPFLSLMYCNHHELFSDDAFSRNPIQTLVQHFQRMRHDSPTLYACLAYLMCVQEHNFKEKLRALSGLINAEVTEDVLENIAKTSAYSQVETKLISQAAEMKKSDETKNAVEVEVASLAHEMLSVALFKSAAEKREVFSPVLFNCEVDLIIQLLRPADSIQSEIFCEFMDASKNSLFRDSAKACVFRLTRKLKKEGVINHPLRTIEFVEEKMKKYLTKSPKFKKKQS